MKNPLILIAGEGRSGTTLMVEILNLLGFDYGGHFEFLREVKVSEDTKFPEVIKHSGGFSVNLSHWVTTYNWKPKHLFYMANDMKTSLAKRLHADPNLVRESGWDREVTMVSHKGLGLSKKTFDRMSASEKETLLQKQLYERLGQAAYGAIECGIPFSLVHYQRFCKDIGYACSIMEPLLRLNKFTIERFIEVHKRYVDLNKVRPWAKND